MPRQPPPRDNKGRFVKRAATPPKPPLDPAFVARLRLAVVPLTEPDNILEALRGRTVIDGR
jgi:hypothetical protein